MNNHFKKIMLLGALAIFIFLIIGHYGIVLEKHEMALLGTLYAPFFGSLLVMIGGRSVARVSNLVSIGLMGCSLLGGVWLWGGIPEDFAYLISAGSPHVGVVDIDILGRWVSLVFRVERVELICFGVINTLAVLASVCLSVRGDHPKFWEVAFLVPLGAFAAAQVVVGYNVAQIFFGYQLLSIILMVLLADGLGHPSRETAADGVEIFLICFAGHLLYVFETLDLREIFILAYSRADNINLLPVSPVDILAGCLLFSGVEQIFKILQGVLRVARSAYIGKDPELEVEGAYFLKVIVMLSMTVFLLWRFQKAILLSGFFGGWVFDLLMIVESACSLFFR